jgi:hypothetical protein
MLARTQETVSEKAVFSNAIMSGERAAELPEELLQGVLQVECLARSRLTIAPDAVL